MRCKNERKFPLFSNDISFDAEITDILIFISAPFNCLRHYLMDMTLIIKAIVLLDFYYSSVIRYIAGDLRVE